MILALSTGDDCLNSCSGKKDGLYQSCATCTKYINCTESVLTEVACTTDMEWDNKEQKCLSESTTCEMSTGSASTLAAGKKCRYGQWWIKCMG